MRFHYLDIKRLLLGESWSAAGGIMEEMVTRGLIKGRLAHTATVHTEAAFPQWQETGIAKTLAQLYLSFFLY